MTHMTPGRDSPVSSRTPATTGFQPSLDRSRLREAIGVRRQRLAEREADLVAACEKAVAHGAGRHIRHDDRTTWDRAAWNRYIETATRLEPAPDQGHRAAGTVGRAPRGPSGVCSMSAVPQNGANEEMRRSAQASNRRLSPRVGARSEPVSVPLPHPRFAVQARSCACHTRRSAFGSRRFRVASLPRQPRRSEAGGPDTGFC